MLTQLHKTTNSTLLTMMGLYISRPTTNLNDKFGNKVQVNQLKVCDDVFRQSWSCYDSLLFVYVFTTM